MKPGIGKGETPPLLAEDLRRRHPAVVEGKDAIMIAAMRHRVVAGSDQTDHIADISNMVDTQALNDHFPGVRKMVARQFKWR